MLFLTLLVFLNWNAIGLNLMAVDKMQDLINGNWSHTNADGCDLGCRNDRYGVRYSWIGENLAKGTGSYCIKSGVYSAWSKSGMHNAVLQEKDIKKEVFIMRKANDLCYSILLRAK